MIAVGRSAELSLEEPSESMIGPIECKPRIETQGFGSSPRHVDPLKAAFVIEDMRHTEKGGSLPVGMRLGQLNNKVRSKRRCILPGLMSL
jgi:hypothetical protein